MRPATPTDPLDLSRFWCVLLVSSDIQSESLTDRSSVGNVQLYVLRFLFEFNRRRKILFLLSQNSIFCSAT